MHRDLADRQNSRTFCRLGRRKRALGAPAIEIKIGWIELRNPLAAVRLAQLERNFVELVAKVLDGRASLVASGILAFKLDLFWRLLPEIHDRQAPAECLVAADLQFGLVILGQILADRLEVADEILKRRIFADIDEILDASRHEFALRRFGQSVTTQVRHATGTKTRFAQEATPIRT